MFWFIVGFWVRDSQHNSPEPPQAKDRPVPDITEADRWDWARDEFIELEYPHLPHLNTQIPPEAIVSVRVAKKSVMRDDRTQDTWFMMVKNENGKVDPLVVSRETLQFLEPLSGCSDLDESDTSNVTQIYGFVDHMFAVEYTAGVCPGAPERVQQYIALYDTESLVKVRFTGNNTLQSHITNNGDLIGSILREYSHSMENPLLLAHLADSRVDTEFLASFDHQTGALKQYIQTSINWY